MSNEACIMSHLNMMATTIWECNNKLSIHRYFAMVIGLFLVITFWMYVNWLLVLIAGSTLVIYGKYIQPMYMFRSSRHFWIYLIKKSYYLKRYGKSGSLDQTMMDFLEKASDHKYASIHGIPEFAELSYRLGRYLKEPSKFIKQIKGDLSPRRRQLIIDICLFLLIAEIVTVYNVQGRPLETEDLIKNIRLSSEKDTAFLRLNNLSRTISEIQKDINSDLINYITRLFNGDNS